MPAAAWVAVAATSLNGYPTATGLGVTLSPVQAVRGRDYNRLAGVADRLRIEARDVYSLGRTD